MTRHALFLAFLAAGCARAPYVSGEPQTIPEPAPDAVAAVVFLVGDAGDASIDGSPLVHRLRRDVERWSEALSADSAVTVLFLGDNVYPAGVHDPGSDDFARDTARLGAQAWTVEGPEAARRGTQAIFLPGNHDWGNMKGRPGEERLRNQESVLAGWQAAGRHVSFLPAAGAPGPVVLGAGPATVIILDTEWWLQADDTVAKEAVIEGLESALLGAGGRPVIVAAHHPIESLGPHGARGGAGLGSLLGRAGALVQDVNSGPYRELTAALSRAFREADRPLVYAAGHDHTLQVLHTVGPGRPAWTLVSGAGSKLTDVSGGPDLEWGAAQPGFMRLMVLRDGGVQLFVETAPASTLSCSANEELDPCMLRSITAYRTVYSARLR